MRVRSLLCVVLAVAAAGGLSAGSLLLETDATASSVNFDVRVNIGVDSFTGRVDRWMLELAMPAEGVLPERVDFTADVSALQTGKDARNEKMRDWLEYETHPQIRFHMTTARETASGIECDGELTIHGVTRPLTIPVTITRNDDALTVRGAVAIDYRDFDLKVIRMMGFLTVKPEVRVEFVVSGALQ